MEPASDAAKRDTVVKFVQLICRSMLAEHHARNPTTADVEFTAQFIHRLSVALFTAVLSDTHANSPPVNSTIGQLEEKISRCPNPTLRREAENSIKKIVKASIPNRKRELFSLVNLLTSSAETRTGGLPEQETTTAGTSLIGSRLPTSSAAAASSVPSGTGAGSGTSEDGPHYADQARRQLPDRYHRGDGEVSVRSDVDENESENESHAHRRQRRTEKEHTAEGPPPSAPPQPAEQPPPLPVRCPPRPDSRSQPTVEFPPSEPPPPDPNREGLPTWRQRTGPLGSLHQQASSLPIGSFTPSYFPPATGGGPTTSPAGSVTPSNVSMADGRSGSIRTMVDLLSRAAHERVKSALSIYPTPEEAIAMIRDVIFCLQGINGQHIKYDPTYSRYLLNREVPLARPLRILAARMVAPGNCFMRVDAVTRGLRHQDGEGPGTNLTSIRHPDFASATKWLLTDGAAKDELALQHLSVPEDPGSAFCLPPVMLWDQLGHKPSLVVFAFLQGIRDELNSFYKDLGNLENDLAILEAAEGRQNAIAGLPAPRLMFSSRTLRRLMVRLKPTLQRLHCLASLATATAGKIGTDLLMVLYECRLHGNPIRSVVTQTIFDAAAGPLISYFRDWLLEGKLRDPYEEFCFEQRGESGINSKNQKNYYEAWKKRLRINWDLAPGFFSTKFILKSFAAGKMANFISMVKGPGHFEAFKKERSADLEAPSAPPIIITEEPPSMLPYSPINDRQFGLPPGEAYIRGTGENTGGFQQNRPDDSCSSHADALSIPPSIPSKGTSEPSFLPVAKETNGTYVQQTSWLPVFTGIHKDAEAAYKRHREDLRKILIEEHLLVQHLDCVRSFLLLGVGDFSDILMTETGDLIIRSGSVDQIVQNEIDLCIEKAVRASVARRKDPNLIRRLRAIQAVPEERFGDSNWDFFTLDYDIADSPVSVVLRSDLMVQYRRIFSFMWKLRRTAKLHQSAWVTTMHNSFLLAFPEVFEILLEVQSLRNEMMHFLQSLESYFFADVIQPAFETMIERVCSQEWADLDQLIAVHEECVQTILYGTFLATWPQSDQAAASSFPSRESPALLMSIHASYLSAAGALPVLPSPRRTDAEHRNNGDNGVGGDDAGNTILPEMTEAGKWIDRLMENASAFAALIDELQIAAYELVSSKLAEGNLDLLDTELATVDRPSAFVETNRGRVENAREEFTLELFQLIDVLTEMKLRFRSDAIGTLLIRLDLNDFYENLRLRAVKGCDEI